MSIALYRFLGVCLAPFLWGMMWYRALTQREDSGRLSERWGYADSAFRPEAPVLWIHGASIGEAKSALSLMKALRSIHPESFILLTTGSLSSAQFIRPYLPLHAQHQFLPYDVWSCVARFLNFWRPQAAFFIEAEVWPLFLSTLRQRRIPTFFVNGRLSERSFRRWSLFGFLIKPLMAGIQNVLVSTSLQKKHFEALGAPMVTSMSNLKWASPPPQSHTPSLRILRLALDGRTTWVASSMHALEEEAILCAHHALLRDDASLVLFFVSRHLDRLGKVAGCANRLGLSTVLLSDILTQEGVIEPGSVVLCDQMGCLGILYSLSEIVFMGGSLEPRYGGHNLIEPAAFSCAICHGPWMHNNQDIADAFQSADASVVVSTSEEVRQCVERWLKDAPRRQEYQDRAQKLVQEREKTAERELEDVAKKVNVTPPITPFREFSLWHGQFLTPAYWERTPSWGGRFCLGPVAFFYQLIGKIRRWWVTPVQAPYPVISVGNVVMGGAGKTPVVLAVAKLLEERGYHPIFVTRGYGGRHRGPLWVNPSHHTSRDVGDEALLLAQHHPTLLARKRSDIVGFETYPTGTIFLLDDGHQHLSLYKDHHILVMDAGQKMGNGALFPLGPLREPLNKALERTDTVIVLYGKDRGDYVPCDLGDRVLISGTRHAVSPLSPHSRVIGFAGLGFPSKFYETLQELSLHVVHFYTFPDHAPYSQDDIETLYEKAKKTQATLVTTEKDMLRIPTHLRSRVQVISLEILFDRPPHLLKDFPQP